MTNIEVDINEIFIKLEAIRLALSKDIKSDDDAVVIASQFLYQAKFMLNIVYEGDVDKLAEHFIKIAEGIKQQSKHRTIH